ncbi:MAG: Flp pilus assembly complex ATPase component [Proteobacteria bacterium]|nr:Flp pilus assembly complex ATPase component [Pseudomonadota bacterium]
MPSPPDSHAEREGLLLRTRWGKREFVPFDEMRALAGPRVMLASGTERALPESLRASAARALEPPAATGRRAEDAAAWHTYTAAGAWSPIRAASALLAMAEAASASDVHLQSEDGGVGVRLRVGGAMVEFASLPAATGRRLVAALKHLSGCLPYRSDIVQEGRVPRDGPAADVRASFLPTALGERAALRLFGRLLALDELGLDADAEAGLAALLEQPSGLVLIAGPSGGGKTTTVYAALAYLAARRSGAHLSIEDPVEQRLRLAGIPVDQVELSPERGLDAEAALVGALRQDVDVVALSEIRTAGEAALAVKAAHTGRLVVAGLHAGSATEARQRMLDLDADPQVLEASLRGVLHQRLAPEPCPDHTGDGCALCAGLGTRRRPAAELWIAEGVA